LAGAAFAYGVVIPWGLHFLLSFQTEGMKPLLGVGPYFSFLIGMILAFGVLFDFPIAIVGLVRLGVLQTARLKRGRRAVIVLILIASAVLTPSPDPVSQLLLAVPLLFLFEVSLFVAGKIEGKRS
jgi:sec-independent protein translocase protein TatC